MELILSAIAAGGLVGVSDQYLSLLIISIASRTGIIELAPPMQFMSTYWFMGIVAVFWILSNAPAYASLLSPGAMHVVNTLSNFLHGFVVPFSSAMIALAAAGIIANINPELRQMLETLKIFTPAGEIGATGYLISGASAVAGTSLTALRAVTKPALSASTGSTGGAAAPTYATLENIMSIVMMGLVLMLSRINPWLLVALFVISVLAVLGILIYAIYQMHKLKRGIGKVLELTQTHPRAGLAVIAEFFVWGSGWFAWNIWARGIIMFLAWVLAIAIAFALAPVLAAVSATFPPFGFLAILLGIILFSSIGLGTSKALFKYLTQIDYETDNTKNKPEQIESKQLNL